MPKAEPLAEHLPNGRAPIPRLWTAFVLGWLLVLAIVAAGLPRIQLGPYRLGASLTLVALLTALFLWLTLRESLTPLDLTAAGPPRVRLRRRLAMVMAMAALVVALAVLVPGQQMWWLVMHPVVAAGLALPPAAAAAATGALLVLAVCAAWTVDSWLDPMLLLLVTFGASAIAIRQLTTTVAQLRNAREELARSAVNEERLRFARDLHDLLGHSLSVMVLKSELAGRLVRQSPDRAEAEITDVERTARDGLRQVRAAVAGYRRPSLANEIAAARELLDAAGIAASVEGSATALPPAVDGLLGWAVREGVTNVVRHSDARSCTIRLTRSAGHAMAEIADDGRGPGEESIGGHGLTGLAERAAAHGARVEAGERPDGGFRLAVHAPLNGTGGDGRR